MKLPKFFGKKNQDDEEDFDEDDFDVSELEEDDFDELNEDLGDEVTKDVIDDDDDDLDVGDEMVGGEASLEKEAMIGGDDELDDPFADSDEFDAPDFDDDFDDDDEYEEEAESSKRKAIIFAAVGAGVLLLSGLGGAGWWYFSDPSEDAKPSAVHDPGRVELAMPAAPGSLNAGGDGAGLNSLAANAVGGSRGNGPDAGSTESAKASPSDSAEVAVAPPAGNLNSLNTLNSFGNSSAGGGLVVPAVAPAALARIPDSASSADQSQALSNAPIAALLEEKDGVGDLPKVGPNGVQPWQAYARPSDPGVTNPKMALLIEGIGLSRQASLGAINKLPPEIAMVLSPYGRDLNDWVFRSRLGGHEVYLSLPMESEDFPMEDPGPYALDTRIQVAENQKRLDTVMASAGGYVGLVTMMGSRFLRAEGQLRSLLQNLNNRGLMFVIGGDRTRNDAWQIAQDLNMARAESEMYIDNEPRIQEIRTNLDRLESLAKTRGYVVAMARPFPVTIQSILDWHETLADKDVVLVPPSALAVPPAATQ